MPVLDCATGILRPTHRSPRGRGRGCDMFELIHIVLRILGRRWEKQAEAAAVRSERVMGPVRAGAEIELDEDEEARVLTAVDAAVREHVSLPETAQVTDYAFYEPTEYGMSVYAEVESTNIAGDRMTNHFVVVLNRGVGVEGCLVFGDDPRGVQRE